MIRVSSIVACLLVLAVCTATARRLPSPRRRNLLSFTADDICQKPQEVAITLSQALVNGSGLSGAESQVWATLYSIKILLAMVTARRNAASPSFFNLLFHFYAGYCERRHPMLRSACLCARQRVFVC